jgi:hypothetical protein
MTFDVEGPFSASQKASWRRCTGKRTTSSACVHYLPVSLSCATQPVRPGRLTTPRRVPCPSEAWPRLEESAALVLAFYLVALAEKCVICEISTVSDTSARATAAAHT